MAAGVRVRAEETPRWKGCGSLTPYRQSTVAFWEPLTSLALSPGRGRLNRDDEMVGLNASRPERDNGGRPTGSAAGRVYPNQLLPFLLACGHQPVSGYPKQGNGTNEVQTITPGGTISGGTWTITWNGETTGAIPYNATAAEIQAFLERFAAVRPGDIVVAGGPVSTGAVTLTFQGQYAATNPAQVTVSAASLTGTAPTLTPTTTTPGAVGSNTDSLGRGATAGVYIWELEARNSALGARRRNEAFTLSFDGLYDEQPIFGEGYAVNSLSVSGDGQWSADMIGLYCQRHLVDPGLTASYDSEAILPVLYSDLRTTWLSGGGPVSGFTWQVSHPHEVVDDAGRVAGHPGRIYLNGITQLAGSLDSGEFDPQDWDYMISAGTFPLTADYIVPSKIASTGVPYRMTVYAPACQLGADGGPEALSNKMRHGASWPWMAKLSQSAGYAHRIILHNAVSAVETYV